MLVIFIGCQTPPAPVKHHRQHHAHAKTVNRNPDNDAAIRAIIKSLQETNEE